MRNKTQDTSYLWGRWGDGIVLRLGSGLMSVHFII